MKGFPEARVSAEDGTTRAHGSLLVLSTQVNGQGLEVDCWDLARRVPSSICSIAKEVRSLPLGLLT